MGEWEEEGEGCGCGWVWVSGKRSVRSRWGVSEDDEGREEEGEGKVGWE